MPALGRVVRQQTYARAASVAAQRTAAEDGTGEAVGALEGWASTRRPGRSLTGRRPTG
ncbi:hypothetical protein [Streptomyces sp. TRM68367]|uniref:hypothetical protein n=1 Tax=Streptomyces sp. TRM68367 TaxID=2758415 RepID=UPI00165C9DA0|nr:hypothetical protein [Streptomyces sp. TRM68367]MBC9724815.1 hypothetical protein [Streptomyces sp. TRM68367]